MMLSPSAGAIRRRFLFISLGIGIGMSVINSFGLQLIYAYFIEGNVAFASVESTFSAVISFLHIATVFAGYAVMIYSTFLFGEKESRIFFFANLLHVAASGIASLGVSFFSMTPALFLLNLGHLLLYLFLNLLLYCALLLLIRFLSLRGRKKLTQSEDPDISLSGQFVSVRHPLLRSAGIATVCYFSFALLLSVAETVQDLLRYGLPVNTEEWIYMVSPYIEEAAYFIISYTVAVAIFYLLQSQRAKLLQGSGE